MSKTLSKENKSLPDFFKSLLWSYDFSEINAEKDKERIIINTINYGDWEHWLWAFNYYGVAEVKKIIENTPASEFRQRALKIALLLLKIKKIRYATRGSKIRAEKNI